MSDWGDRISDRRRQLGMSRSELARQAGVSATTAHDWETGKTAAIAGDALFNVAEALRVTPEWIIRGGELPDVSLERDSFGQRLRKLRMQRKLTQQELAERIGLKASAIGYFENGLRAPAPETIQKLLDALSATADDLFPAPLFERAEGEASLPISSTQAAVEAAVLPSQSARPDLGKLRAAIEMVERALEELGIDYPPDTKAQIVVAVYSAIEAAGEAAAAKDVVATMLKTVSKKVTT